MQENSQNILVGNKTLPLILVKRKQRWKKNCYFYLNCMSKIPVQTAIRCDLETIMKQEQKAVL